MCASEFTRPCQFFSYKNGCFPQIFNLLLTERFVSPSLHPKRIKEKGKGTCKSPQIQSAQKQNIMMLIMSYVITPHCSHRNGVCNERSFSRWSMANAEALLPILSSTGSSLIAFFHLLLPPFGFGKFAFPHQN